MTEFFDLVSSKEAQKIFFDSYTPEIETEVLESRNALGRVTARMVTAPFSLPSFPRSTVDGYAVRASDTYGATESLPVYLKLAGEIPMGMEPGILVDPTGCALIHTGGMLPKGTDAVVMIENTQISQEQEIEVMKAAAVGENIVEVGEDIRLGDELLPVGKRIKEADIGGLMAMGIMTISVAEVPKVGIISTGDEVVPPEINPEPGQVRDINSYSLSSLISRHGGLPKIYGIIPDDFQSLRDTSESALTECDMVLITAGSSVSHRDITSQVIDQLGEPGVLVHGINIRPGKPTILSVCNGKAVIGLPGNPVSAFVIAKLFVIPILKRLSGENASEIQPVVSAELTVNLSSQSGREDWVPVKISRTGNTKYKAEPVFGKSNLIFLLVKSDGLIRIPAENTGLSAGERVEVILL